MSTNQEDLTTDDFYEPQERALMKEHQLSEDEFDTLNETLRRFIKDWGTETVEAMVKYVGEDLFNED